MSSKFNRKPVAVAALFASSIGTVLAAGGAAHATTYGGAGTNPVTITTGGAIHIVGGGTVALPAGAHDVSWAGQGGRFAFVGADNGIWTADFDGSHGVKVAQGVAPSHTVWDASNEAVYWTEGTGAGAKVVGALANGGSLGTDHPTFDLVQASVAPAGLGLSSPDVASDLAGSIVLQTTDASGNTGIGLSSYDSNGQQSFTTIVAPDVAAKGGWSPTISADGKTVVFVRNDANGDAQLFATSWQNNAWSAPKQITWMTGGHAAPVFEAATQSDTQSINDLTVAFEFTNRKVQAGNNADGTYQVNVTQALAASAPAPQLETSVSTLSGGLAVRTDNPGHVFRFAGSDRVDTAVLASRHSWRTAGQNDPRPQAKSVVLSRSDVFADALGGAALAAHKNGPLLLTETSKLNPETLAEIRRILPTPGTVYLLGGTAAISPAVQTALTKLGYTVDRIAGQDRFETAVKIADAIDPNASDVLVATGTNYPDALSAGAAAGTYNGMVVLLTNGNAMPASTDAYLQAKLGKGPVNVAAVGGAADKALKSAKYSGYAALVGADRYQTSYLVAHDIFGAFSSVGVATGANWPDSLSGGALMGERQGPLLLVDPKAGLSAADNALIDANRGASNWAYVFGGTGALPLRVDQQLAADIATASGSATSAGHAATAHLSTPNVAKG
ncbi:cell wall-binding repeat-containing protein [Catenulispora sp. GAS73]|uniref:cell wall-binding repeat-containing protein n=1 Tax=Catenulispora sp. GAS73 TaxID=3156269 RepID=UPI0035132D4C